MEPPSQPVTLTVQQIIELNRELSTMRHDINNYLSLIQAAAELIRVKPQMSERMMTTLTEQPPKITDAIARFTREFDAKMGTVRL